MAERSCLDDPLNLMRVMPPKEARVRCRTGDFSHAIFCAWLFSFNHEWTSLHNVAAWQARIDTNVPNLTFRCRLLSSRAKSRIERLGKPRDGREG